MKNILITGLVVIIVVVGAVFLFRSSETSENPLIGYWKVTDYSLYNVASTTWSDVPMEGYEPYFAFFEDGTHCLGFGGDASCLQNARYEISEEGTYTVQDPSLQGPETRFLYTREDSGVLHVTVEAQFNGTWYPVARYTLLPTDKSTMEADLASRPSLEDSLQNELNNLPSQ